MSEETNRSTKKTSTDWLLRGILTKVGDMFDALTGRRWAPSSSLATSELIEKLKKLLDSEVQENGAKGKFVPHNIKLKMQWDKFSTDESDAIRRLENELKIAAIDHINDNRYHTHAPIHLQIAPDYFTEGVKLLVSFEKFSEDQREAEVNVTVPQIKVGDYLPEPPPAPEPEPQEEIFIARFVLSGKPKEIELKFKEKTRRSVGRTKENELAIEDASVSKIHAALLFNSSGQLLVSDTGSTNGTFINDQRLAYGRAFPVSNADKVKFGNIEVTFEKIARVAENSSPAEAEIASVSQSDLQTLAFNSNEAVSVKSEFIPQPPASTPLAPAKEISPETRFVSLKPEAPPETKPKPDNSAVGTQDRINYDFKNEE